MKGQTWIEFIVATSIFLLSIGFIFITASGNLKEEVQKSQQQTSCLKTYELEYLLKQQGIPADWDSSTGFSVFGLSSGMPLVISNDKWLVMKNFGFANVSQNATPSQSWNINYNSYAFEFKPDILCTVGDGVRLCRTNTYILIDVTSTQQSVAKLQLYFPFSTATAISSDTEGDDLISTTTANGTYINLAFNTNSTDSDSVNISASPVPEFVFVKQLSTESVQEMPFVMGNSSLQDSFGAFAPPNAMICNTKVSGLLNLTTENLLVTYNLEAW